jgi:hypothetical protein
MVARRSRGKTFRGASALAGQTSKSRLFEGFIPWRRMCIKHWAWYCEEDLSDFSIVRNRAPPRVAAACWLWTSQGKGRHRSVGTGWGGTTAAASAEPSNELLDWLFENKGVPFYSMANASIVRSTSSIV